MFPTSLRRPSGRTPTPRHLPALEALEDRTLLSLSPPAAYPVGSGPSAVATGDFNNDGNLDLVTADVGGNTVSLLLGNGDGTFQNAGSLPAGGASPNALAVGDFNNDGNLDLAVSNGFSQVSVF